MRTCIYTGSMRACLHVCMHACNRASVHTRLPCLYLTSYIVALYTPRLTRIFHHIELCNCCFCLPNWFALCKWRALVCILLCCISLLTHLQTCKGMTKSMLSSKEELLVAAAIGTRPADRDRVKAPIFTDEEEVKALR